MSLDHGGGGGGHGGGGGGGGHHGGGGGGHGGGHRGYGGGGGFRGYAEWPWPAPTYIVEPPIAPTCTWSEPVAMTPALTTAGQHALEATGTYPAFGHVGGLLYQFTIHNGALVARSQVCTESGVVGDGDGILPFLPAGLTRALGLPPPEAGHLLNALGYAATLIGVRTFQVAQGLPDTGIVDDATMGALHTAASAAGLGDPPPEIQPTGTPIFEAVSAAVAPLAQALRTASREFEREIASVKAGVSDPPQTLVNRGPQPTTPQPLGQSIKSIETPEFLRGASLFP